MVDERGRRRRGPGPKVSGQSGTTTRVRAVTTGPTVWSTARGLRRAGAAGRVADCP